MTSLTTQDQANLVKLGSIIDAVSAMIGFSFVHQKTETIKRTVSLFNEFHSSLTESEKTDYLALCEKVLKDRIEKTLPSNMSQSDSANIQKTLSELSQQLNLES